MAKIKTISIYPGGIINQNGNNMNLTLEGFGSVTPPAILQEFINKLSRKEINEWANRCDQWQKDYGHKKFEWKKPLFKKKVSILRQFGRKIWTVEVGDFTGGYFMSFRTLQEAIIYAKTNRNIFVDIRNEITNESFRVRDMS